MNFYLLNSKVIEIMPLKREAFFYKVKSTQKRVLSTKGGLIGDIMKHHQKDDCLDIFELLYIYIYPSTLNNS